MATLTGVAKALPSCVQALPHVVSAVSHFIEPETIDRAASLGLMRVLQVFSDLKATTAAMDGAATHGHFDVVKWLHFNRSEGCTTAAIEGAAGRGHLEMMQWLYGKRGLVPTGKALVQATRGSYLDVMKWILEHDNPPLFTRAPLETVAATGNVKALGLLLQYGTGLALVDPQHLIHIMVQNNREEMLMYFVFEQWRCPVRFVTDELIKFTISRNNLLFMKQLLETKYANVTIEQLNMALEAKPVNFAMVEILATYCDKIVLFQQTMKLVMLSSRDDDVLTCIPLLVNNLSPHAAGILLMRAVIEKRVDNSPLFRERASLEMKMIALELAAERRDEHGLAYISEICAGLTSRELDDALLEAVSLNLRHAVEWIRPKCSESGRFRAQLVEERRPALDNPMELLENRLASVVGGIQNW